MGGGKPESDAESVSPRCWQRVLLSVSVCLSVVILIAIANLLSNGKAR